MNQSWKREDFLVSQEESMLWANNSEGIDTENQSTGESAGNDPSSTMLQKALPLKYLERIFISFCLLDSLVI